MRHAALSRPEFVNAKRTIRASTSADDRTVRRIMAPRKVSFIFATLIAITTARDCQCGFSVNATSEPEHQIFTDYLESDFTQGNRDGWTPQEWSIDQAKARGPYGKNASSDNVVLTEEGMQLWVRRAVNKVIGTAEVGSMRTDMMYGTFRMRAKMGTANGTCGAMFWVSIVQR